MSRSRTTLQPPDPTRDYRDFPAAEVPAGARWFRAHGAHSPWWYSCAVGRFNLHDPRGTLNLASSATTAAREALGAVLTADNGVHSSQLADRWVSGLDVPAARVADLTAEGAIAYGLVPGDVSGPLRDYTVTRQWAHQWDTAGFEGVRSRSRFGAGADPRCLFLFGPAGEHETGRTQTRVPLREVLETTPGLRIDPKPPTADMVVDP